MRDPGEKWVRELERWSAPYLHAFQHKVRQRWAPMYLRGLLLPGERKSIEPLVDRVAPGERQQIHHFVAAKKVLGATSPSHRLPFQLCDDCSSIGWLRRFPVLIAHVCCAPGSRYKVAE
jgi:hypothetical protein